MTQADDEMDKVVRTIDELSPGFSSRIQGASESDLQLFLKMAEMTTEKVPPIYLAFLRCMGQNLGGLELGADAAFDIAHARYPRIGDGRGCEFNTNVFLHSTHENESRVFLRLDYHHNSWLAGSLVQWLCGRAVEQWSAKRYSRFVVLGERETTPIPKVFDRKREESLPAVLSANRLWFSNDWVSYFQAERNMLIISQFPGEHLAFKIYAKDPEDVIPFSRAAMDTLGIDTGRSWNTLNALPNPWNPRGTDA